MLLYFSLCIIFNMLYFFTTTIWKLRPKSIYASPIYFVSFTSLVCYFATKAEFYNVINQKLNESISYLNINKFLSVLFADQYVSELEKYFNNNITLDYVVSSVFLILFGIICLDFPNYKQKIDDQKDIIYQMQIDLRRSELDNKRLIKKNNELLNIDSDTYTDADPDDYAEYVLSDNEDVDTNETIDDTNETIDDTNETIDDANEANNLANKIHSLSYQLSNCLENLDTKVNETEINKLTKKKCKEYRNKVYDIFYHTIKKNKSNTNVARLISTIKRDIGKIDF